MFVRHYFDKLMKNQLKISIKLAKLWGLVPLVDWTRPDIGLIVYSICLIIYYLISFSLIRTVLLFNLLEIRTLLSVVAYFVSLTYTYNVLKNLVFKFQKWNAFLTKLELYTEESGKLEIIDMISIFLVIISFLRIVFLLAATNSPLYILYKQILFFIIMTDAFLMRSVLKRFKNYYTKTLADLNDILCYEPGMSLNILNLESALKIRDIGRNIRLFSEIIQEYDSIMGSRVGSIIGLIFLLYLLMMRDVLNILRGIVEPGAGNEYGVVIVMMTIYVVRIIK